MEYGLIGSKLTHSFSKYLHEEFLNTNYELKSLNIDELDSFFKEKDFKGILMKTFSDFSKAIDFFILRGYNKAIKILYKERRKNNENFY